MAYGVSQNQAAQNHYRSEKDGKFNTIFNRVPNRQEWQIERWGKWNRTTKAGLNFVFPIVDKIAYVRSLKEQVIPVDPQHAFTNDNVEIGMSGSIYFKVIDSYKASYGVTDHKLQLSTLAQAIMRKAVGKLDLDTLFKERASINKEVTTSLEKATAAWGIQVLRYEIQDINIINPATRKSLQQQSDAERDKRASILGSEGRRQSKINDSEGERIETVNQAKANAETIRLNAQANADRIRLRAQAESESILKIATAEAKGIDQIAGAINKNGGKDAVQQRLADNYLKQYGSMMQKSNTVIIPSDPNNVAGLISTAKSIFKTIDVPKSA